MRSTRATAAVARLNQRVEGNQYLMVMTGSGQFLLRQRQDGIDHDISGPLVLDDFVHFVNAQGPQKVLRVTKNDAAFAKQLIRKT